MSEIEGVVNRSDGGASSEEKVFSSPPASARGAAEEPDPRAKLHELARKLASARNRRLMLEYLRLRRAVAAMGQ